MGHDLKVTKNITHHIKEYECKTCGEKFTTSPSGHIITLTETRAETNTILEDFYIKKLRRKGLSMGS
ncbi:hypothetical protein MHTCC0001_00340 [Flavobacteriaceae bacterium MHTCC 0001]